MFIYVILHCWDSVQERMRKYSKTQPLLCHLPNTVFADVEISYALCCGGCTPLKSSGEIALKISQTCVTCGYVTCLPFSCHTCIPDVLVLSCLNGCSTFSQISQRSCTHFLFLSFSLCMFISYGSDYIFFQITMHLVLYILYMSPCFQSRFMFQIPTMFM